MTGQVNNITIEEGKSLLFCTRHPSLNSCV